VSALDIDQPEGYNPPALSHMQYKLVKYKSNCEEVEQLTSRPQMWRSVFLYMRMRRWCCL